MFEEEREKNARREEEKNNKIHSRKETVISSLSDYTIRRMLRRIYKSAY